MVIPPRGGLLAPPPAGRGRGCLQNRHRLLDELQGALLAMTDERNGNRPISLVHRTGTEFAGPHLTLGPDLIVGYSRGYRSSWENPLGEFPPEVIVDNDDPWSGDHQNDYRLVPGILLTNQRITRDQPALADLTVSVLDEFNVPSLPDMKLSLIHI